MRNAFFTPGKIQVFFCCTTRSVLLILQISSLLQELAKKVAENPEIGKGVQKGMDQGLNALGRDLQTIDTSTLAAIVGGPLVGAAYVNNQEEVKKREVFRQSQRRELKQMKRKNGQPVLL